MVSGKQQRFGDFHWLMFGQRPWALGGEILLGSSWALDPSPRDLNH